MMKDPLRPSRSSIRNVNMSMRKMVYHIGGTVLDKIDDKKMGNSIRQNNQSGRHQREHRLTS